MTLYTNGLEWAGRARRTKKGISQDGRTTSCSVGSATFSRKALELQANPSRAASKWSIMYRGLGGSSIKNCRKRQKRNMFFVVSKGLGGHRRLPHHPEQQTNGYKKRGVRFGGVGELICVWSGICRQQYNILIFLFWWTSLCHIASQKLRLKQ